MNQSVRGCSQLPSWRGDKEEGADTTADMLVLRMKSLIRMKEDLVKEPSVSTWQGSCIYRHCFLVLLRARASLLCMMDAIQGRISVPQKARGFLKHDLISSLQNFMKQVFLATFMGEESEASGRF